MRLFQRFYPVFIGIAVLGLGSFVNGDDSNQGPLLGGHPPHMKLTDEQRTCLDGKLVQPGEGERPSKDAMEAAFKACGVPKPDGPPPAGDLQQ
jgi:hypothetical protein